MAMTCSARTAAITAKPAVVSVNGIVVPRDAIAREVQQHPAATPLAAWKKAARALVIRELLLQEARRLQVSGNVLSDDEGRRETDDEAAIRTLIEQEVTVPEPDEDSCRRYYEQNLRRFRSADIYEAAHILIAADARDQRAHRAAYEKAAAILAQLARNPARFGDLARAFSGCPSAAQGGNLGQITAGQTTPEFERALAAMNPGMMSPEPIATRYGFHVIRLDRKIAGKELPFEAVAKRIADYLSESVTQRATAQYIARLAARADLSGVDLATPESHRVS
jgi:peptidyl-prolyl cis-trans isomerase C